MHPHVIQPGQTATPHSHAGPHAHKPHRGDTAGDKHQQLVWQTQKWVAQTFFGQMLKQMRQSPFKSKLFDGGRGGEAFQEMFDQRLAEHMASGTGHKLVDTIVRRIEARNAYAATAAATSASSATTDRGHA